MFICCSATPAKRYEARENAGEVVFTYNPGSVLVENISWKGHHSNLIIKNSVDDKPLAKRFKYMFQKVFDKSQGISPFLIPSFLILPNSSLPNSFPS